MYVCDLFACVYSQGTLAFSLIQRTITFWIYFFTHLLPVAFNGWYGSLYILNVYCVLTKCISAWYNCHGWLGVKNNNDVSVYPRHSAMTGPALWPGFEFMPSSDSVCVAVRQTRWRSPKGYLGTLLTKGQFTSLFPTSSPVFAMAVRTLVLRISPFSGQSLLSQAILPHSLTSYDVCGNVLNEPYDSIWYWD